MEGLPRVGGYGTPRMHGACLPLCSAPVPMCHKAQGLHTWEIVGLLEPWRGWSWLGNEKGHRVGSWKANRASGVDTHAQGLRYKDNTNVLTMVYVDTHRLRHTQRNRDTHTAVTGKDTHMQKSRGILWHPDTQTPRDTGRYTQTHKGYIDIHTSTAM